ncbi:MAG: substrate-binding domain-containing protein [Actinobacteria bacterium]|nr:substrate-binding domain-containing protein [Actinomycetota bacterium]
MKKVLVLTMVFVLAVMLAVSFSLAGCKQETAAETEAAETEAAETEAAETEAAETEAAETEAAETEAAAGPYDIAFVVKSQAQPFWIHVRIGGMNYAKENPDKINATLYAAKDDAAVEEGLAILEDVLVTEPDAVVMALINPETMAPIAERFIEAGIPAVMCGDSIKQYNDNYSAEFLSYDYGGGEMAAEYLIDYLKANNKPLTGKIAIHSALAGLVSLQNRCNGFQDKVMELAPDMEFLEWVYSDVDSMKEVTLTQDQISAYGDELTCVYLDAGPTLPAAIQVFREQGVSDKITLIGWDSSPEAIAGLEDGNLKGLVLQDPFQIGYQSMEAALKILEGGSLNLEGEIIPRDNLLPTVVFDKDDVGTQEAAEFLDPTLIEIK